MGQCLDRLNEEATDDDEVRVILRSNPFLQRLPYISAVAELQRVGPWLSAMPGEFCWSRELSKNAAYELTVDSCFDDVVRGCQSSALPPRILFF